MGIRITPGSPGSTVSVSLANSGSQIQDLLVSGGLQVVGNTLGAIATFSNIYVDTITASSSGSQFRDLKVEGNLQVAGNIFGSITDVTFGDISVSTVTASVSGSQVPAFLNTGLQTVQTSIVNGNETIKGTLTVQTSGSQMPTLSIFGPLNAGTLNIGSNIYASTNYLHNGNDLITSLAVLDTLIKNLSGSIASSINAGYAL